MDEVFHPDFLMLDTIRRAQGEVLAAVGYGPLERQYDVAACTRRWRLRDYAGGTRASLLMIGAPIKRPYIWDLAPSISALGYCLDQGFRVHLLEWTAPNIGDEPICLDDYVEAISDAVNRVKATVGAAMPILLGHSLGGTLAAVFVALDPASVAGLVLLGAPLCFGAGTSRFRDAVAALPGSAPAPSELVPGSLLGHASALAAPADFVWSRLTDAALSRLDAQALETHLRVERWALDEVALPGHFMGQVLAWLYREDRFRRGVLPVKGRGLGPRNLTTPTLAAVDAGDGVVPLAAVEEFLAASPARTQIVVYPGETGVALQHLALLIGLRARATVWPQIFAWIDGLAATAPPRD
ncbi:MAG TPA: alpha/beta fold hydrolase [Phenylobacterium sp.]|uniref:alpha/beta fold hydrolase n=1 Tax=Phenylobacterium sp. TaxID=1871053 RepID=UPI002B46CE3A|nr:alpha/beta fold hydrolase [Phenylobacterium sp.]HKR89398.1 alpha/beta fold hydrolase [Phenylobacterium sp.]HKT53957.1 alpha/beta fold hydrolase [Caulobacteraceae bacterium]